MAEPATGVVDMVTRSDRRHEDTVLQEIRNGIGLILHVLDVDPSKPDSVDEARDFIRWGKGLKRGTKATSRQVRTLAVGALFVALWEAIQAKIRFFAN
jgi:hypothetical protein